MVMLMVMLMVMIITNMIIIITCPAGITSAGIAAGLD